LGLINTDPTISLNASMAPSMPRCGTSGFFSQSGALGVALLDAVDQRGLGLSTFVSAGNRADISGNDLLQYWDEHERTDVVMLYLESIGNPRKFSRIARRLSRRKPVVAVKAGRSTQGVPLGQAASSASVPPEAVEQMFRQSGVIRTDTVAQMFDVAQLLSAQPLPNGERVLAVGNSNAMVLMAADAVEVNGLQWVDPPIVFAPDASAGEFENALAGAIDDPAVDSILALYVTTLHDTGEGVAAALRQVASRAAKPVVGVLYSVEGPHRLLRQLSSNGGSAASAIPTYPAVEDAVRALAAITFHARWRRDVTDSPVDPPGIDVDRGRALVTEWLREHPDGLTLGQEPLSHLLSCYGIQLWPRGTAYSVEEAASIANELGYPVVLKTADSHLRLRSDLGGIYFDIGDEAELRRQYDARLAELQPLDYDRLVVQRQAQPGAAVVLETTEDALFGPVMSFGLAGVAYDVLRDRSYAIPPLTSSDVDTLIEGPRAARLLDKAETGAPLDLAPLRDLIARVSRLADDLPEIARLTLRPIVVATKGTSVLGGMVRIEVPAVRSDLPARRLLG
jgi:acyl-CoA synthetase (NDP forming)